MRGGLQHSDPAKAFQASLMQASLVPLGVQDPKGLPGLTALTGTVCTCNETDRGTAWV